MSDIVRSVSGDVIEPPLTIDKRLEFHCESASRDFTNGDYFHLLARDALAEITRLRALVEEMGKALERVTTEAVYIGRNEYAVNGGSIDAATATLTKAKEQS